MLLDKIEISGYRRLSKAAAYVGRKTVALVGPNESGKSSVLAALRLFEDDQPVDPRTHTRSDRGTPRLPQDDVVVAWMALTDEQIARIPSGVLQEPPTHYLWHKKVDGQRKFSLKPFPRLSAPYRESVLRHWSLIESAVLKDADLDEESRAQFELDSVQVERQVGGHEIESGVVERINAWTSTLEGLGVSAKTRRALDKYEEFLKLAGPDTSLQLEIRKLLGVVNPTFAAFGEPERNIASEYIISSPETQASIALENLLRVAKIDLATIRQNAAEPAYLQQLLDDANVRLADFFSQRWGQEPVAVGLFVEGDTLRVFVKDLREGSAGWLDITERSDGLRMFVALATFLARKAPAVPPILLIDEADQHLHLNAQADLVRMLQELDQISQVIYTTHSPGCLPTDLGNGVRFVEPLPAGRSRIRHDFWSLQDEGHVGFNPLLMVMGAGAAAFSGLRSALIVEGASDMLLLPTIIRAATGQSELSYQVAPGLSVASHDDVAKLDLTASRVAFLVDGDDGGTTWREDLVASGVLPNRIRSLPEGAALEDLLAPDTYISAVAGFLGVAPEAIEIRDRGRPVKAQVTAWATAAGLSMPGPVSIAEHLLGRHEDRSEVIRVNPSYKRNIVALHKWASSLI